MKISPQPYYLNENSLVEGTNYLCEIDASLGKIVKKIGYPPLWPRKPGFPTLILIILEQQVSLASAKAAFTKLESAAEDITPKQFLEFTDGELKEIGFSRQKARYGRALSKAIRDGKLDLDELNTKDDQTVRMELIRIKGIGQWTADIYLLRALLRPDIWPMGDLALAKAVQNVYGLSERPGQEHLNEIAERWIPWRAVAARILWHHYLND